MTLERCFGSDGGLPIAVRRPQWSHEGEGPMLEPKRVLVTDGHSQQHHLVTRSLERAGYSVQVAHGVEEAWSLLERTPFDLWVIDPDLARADPAEWMRRGRECRPGLTVLVLTAGELSSADSGRGVNVVMPKPIRNWGELVDAVSDALKLASEPWPKEPWAAMPPVAGEVEPAHP